MTSQESVSLIKYHLKVCAAGGVTKLSNIKIQIQNCYFSRSYNELLRETTTLITTIDIDTKHTEQNNGHTGGTRSQEQGHLI